MNREEHLTQSIAELAAQSDPKNVGPCPLLSVRQGDPYYALGDGIGYVAVMRYSGTEAQILDHARQSTGSKRQAEVDVNGHINHESARLLRRLLRDRHTSPEELTGIVIRWRAPIFVARQVMRHRTASLSEASGRYGEIPPLYYVPQVNNDRESPRFFSRDHRLQLTMVSGAQVSFYQNMRREGVPNETARLALGVNFYTQWDWKMDLNNLTKFLVLRCAPDAQWETQQYARIILKEFLYSWMPFAARYVESTLIHRWGLKGFGAGKYEPVGACDTRILLAAVRYYHRDVPTLPGDIAEVIETAGPTKATEDQTEGTSDEPTADPPPEATNEVDPSPAPFHERIEDPDFSHSIRDNARAIARKDEE